MRRSPEAVAREFADRAPIGTPCRYYPILPAREGDVPEKTRIRSEPWVVAGDQVIVKVEGRAGGVSIDHIVLGHADGLAEVAAPGARRLL